MVEVNNQVDGFRLNRENLIMWTDSKVQKLRIEGNVTRLLDCQFPLSREQKILSVKISSKNATRVAVMVEDESGNYVSLWNISKK